MKINEIMKNYSLEIANAKNDIEKDKALKKANADLQAAGCNFHIDPVRNVITTEEESATTISIDMKDINGYGMLDTGIGVMDKVKIEHSKLVNGGVGDMFALVIIGNLMFDVKDDMITTLHGVIAH